MMVRVLVLLAILVVRATAADVPEAWRVDFKECAWGVGGDFVEGPSNRNRPTAMGRVEETQIIWNKQVYPIDTFAIKDDRTAVVAFQLGTLTVTNKNERQHECRFKDAATGKEHAFRTGGWKW